MDNNIQFLVGNYKYEWSLQEHPDNSQEGEMTGIHTDTLKLSKVYSLLVITVTKNFFMLCDHIYATR